MQIKKKIKALILGVMAFCSCNSLAEENLKIKISIFDNCSSSGGKIFIITKNDWQESIRLCGNEVTFSFKNNILKVRSKFTEALQNVGGSNGWRIFVGTSHIVIRQ
jgi:lipoprotein